MTPPVTAMDAGRSTGMSIPPLTLLGDRSVTLLVRGDEESMRKVERSINFMAQNINQPLQVSTLAALANVSPSHFFALFKQATGHAPMDFFTRLRMRKACELFESSRASVKEVAAIMGYDDPFYFSRVFKAVNQVPPSRYRASRNNPCA